MVIVDAVRRIEIQRPGAIEIFAVGLDGLLVPVHNVVVVAAQHVDMGGHVDQVPGIRNQFAQPVAGHQRPLWKRRHFHQVHIEVQQSWVIPGRRIVGESRFQKVHGFFGPGAVGNASGFQIPHFPRCQHQDRFRQHAHDVEPGLMIGS